MATLSDFLSADYLPTPDIVTTWKQRGVPSFDAQAIKAKCSFLRDHLAEYLKDHAVDLSATIKLSREKVGDFGIGELLVLSTGHRFAAAACEFRVMEEPLAPLAVPEKPVAKAAAPRRDSKGRFVKKATKKSDNFRGIIDYSPAEVDDAIASFLGRF